MGNKKDIPEGWLDYSPLGKQIPGTIIICFKVPLKENICRNMPESQRFTTSMLMNRVPNLCGVIDVTNTPRYYNKQDLLDKGILHEKIQCPGHAVPPASVVDYFQKTMEKMWTAANSARGKLVGVHCTHGINRTGYLVCRYLIECHGFQPEDAIRLFAESRGHGIERQNYLSDLRTLTPGHRSPNSISWAEFAKMEEERRAYWNTDATDDSVRPRRGNRSHAAVPPTEAHKLVTPHAPPQQEGRPPALRGDYQHSNYSQRHHLQGQPPPHPTLPQQSHGVYSQRHHLQGQPPPHLTPPQQSHGHGFMGGGWDQQHGATSSVYQPWHHPNFDQPSFGHGSVYGEVRHYGNHWNSSSSHGGGYYHDRRSREVDDGQYNGSRYRGQQERYH